MINFEIIIMFVLSINSVFNMFYFFILKDIRDRIARLEKIEMER